MTTATDRSPSYLFRGDDSYRGGPVGKALGSEADEAEIQGPADHVLKKETHRSSRFTSFTTELKIARRFTAASDARFIRKVSPARLRELEGAGSIRLWDAESVFGALRQGSRKTAKLASAVRDAMTRNREILVEGQVPEGCLEQVED